MNAIELLTSYSGESAEQYAPFFQFSDAKRIVGTEIHAVGTDSTTARFCGAQEAWNEVNNILRVTTADGSEGVSGVSSDYQGHFSTEHSLQLESVAAELIGLQSLDPLVVADVLERTRPDLSDAVRASVDIALWDLAARRADRPLFEIFGARRSSIEAYASLPFYESLIEYVDAVRAYAKLGYRTFKFHVWGSIDEDVLLVDTIQTAFSDSPYRFMIDAEGAYNFEDALTLGRAMDEGLFVWLEAPVRDELLDQYAELRSKLTVPVIPAGYDAYTPDFLRQGIEIGAWDAGRFDVANVGGFSKALELLTIANDGSLPIEIQSWGHSLAQAANLHLMLANERTRYFESPMPKNAYEFGMTNGDLLKQGRVCAPKGPGLGIEVDWDQLSKADFYASNVRSNSLTHM